MKIKEVRKHTIEVLAKDLYDNFLASITALAKDETKTSNWTANAYNLDLLNAAKEGSDDICEKDINNGLKALFSDGYIMMALSPMEMDFLEGIIIRRSLKSEEEFEIVVLSDDGNTKYKIPQECIQW